MRRFFTPPMALAMLALFVALGGSALAVRSARPVTACGNGSVKAFAAIDTDRYNGAFPRQFSTAAQNFAARWQCNGRSPEVRDAGADAFQIRFPGIAVRSAVATGYTSRTRGSVNINITGDIVNVYTATAPGNAAGSFGFSIAVY